MYVCVCLCAYVYQVFVTWHLQTEKETTKTRLLAESSAVRHTQIHHLLDKHTHTHRIRPSFLALRAHAQHHICAASRTQIRKLLKCRDLVQRCVRGWDDFIAEVHVQRVRSDMQTTLDENSKALQICRQNLAQALLSARRVEEDLRIRTTEVARELADKTELEAENTKQFLSNQHLCTRVLQRDLRRALACWHVHVGVAKWREFKAQQQHTVRDRLHTTAVWHCWLDVVRKQHTLNMTAAHLVERMAHGRLRRVMDLWFLYASLSAHLHVCISKARQRRIRTLHTHYATVGFAALQKRREKAGVGRWRYSVSRCSWMRRLACPVIEEWRINVWSVRHFRMTVRQFLCRRLRALVLFAILEWRYVSACLKHVVSRFNKTYCAYMLVCVQLCVCACVCDWIVYLSIKHALAVSLYAHTRILHTQYRKHILRTLRHLSIRTKITHQNLVCLLHAWSEGTRHGRLCRKLSQRVAAKMHKHAVASVVCVWRASMSHGHLHLQIRQRLHALVLRWCVSVRVCVCIFVRVSVCVCVAVCVFVYASTTWKGVAHFDAHTPTIICANFSRCLCLCHCAGWHA